MSQITEEKAAKFIQNRLSKFQIRMTDDEALNLITLLRNQGYKLTSRDPDEDMLKAVEGVKFGPGTTFHTVDLLWQKLWEAA